MSPHKRRLRLPKRLDAMPQIISRIPWHPGMLRKELDKAITRELDAIWSDLLSEKELQQKAQVERGEAANVSFEARSKLDEVILVQAETLSWRLFVSTGVLKRISQWEDEAHGPQLFEKLGKALAMSVQIVQKKVLPPINNPDLVATQDQTVRELRTLRSEMKRMFSKNLMIVGDREILKCFTTAILNSDKKTLLRANLRRWQAFFEQRPASLRTLALGERPSPVELFREWLAWCKGHEPETLRKKISGLRSALKKQ
jgi:hypothetical protein